MNTLQLPHFIYREKKGGQLVGISPLVPGNRGLEVSVTNNYITNSFARFHATADGTLFIVAAIGESKPDGSPFVENWLIECGKPETSTPVRLDLDEPLTTFFTATVRGGSPALDVLDLFGTGEDPATLPYYSDSPAVRLITRHFGRHRVNHRPRAEGHRPSRGVVGRAFVPRHR